MTVMGLNFLVHEETTRANIAREAETQRHNIFSENLSQLQFGETVRSNKAYEGIQNRSLDETIRSNQARETLNKDQLTETIRSNRVRESQTGRQIDLGFQSLGEQVRANKARETETIRSNIANEVERNRSAIKQEEIRTREQNLNYLSKHNPIAGLQQIPAQEGATVGRKFTNKFWGFVDYVADLVPSR